MGSFRKNVLCRNYLAISRIYNFKFGFERLVLIISSAALVGSEVAEVADKKDGFITEGIQVPSFENVLFLKAGAAVPRFSRVEGFSLLIILPSQLNCDLSGQAVGVRAV